MTERTDKIQLTRDWQIAFDTRSELGESIVHSRLHSNVEVPIATKHGAIRLIDVHHSLKEVDSD